LYFATVYYTDFRTSILQLFVHSLLLKNTLPRKRKIERRAIRTSAAAGFEPTPTPEVEDVKQDYT
jgi:hypothetical protein